MRLIAERLLPVAEGSTCVKSDVICPRGTPLLPPKDGHRYHVYCSPLNPGAIVLMKEVARERGFHLHMPGAPLEATASNVLHITTQAAHMGECDHFLLYLTAQTWTRGDQSEAFGAEVSHAMDLGVHVLLARADGLTP